MLLTYFHNSSNEKECKIEMLGKNHRQEVLYSTFDLGNQEFNCKVRVQFYKKSRAQK